MKLEQILCFNIYMLYPLTRNSNYYNFDKGLFLLFHIGPLHEAYVSLIESLNDDRQIRPHLWCNIKLIFDF